MKKEKIKTVLIHKPEMDKGKQTLSYTVKKDKQRNSYTRAYTYTHIGTDIHTHTYIHTNLSSYISKR